MCEKEHYFFPVYQHRAAPLGCVKPQVCDRIFEYTDHPSSSTTLRYAGR